MVELGCGKTCMKYILFVINFIFFLLGATAFGLGIWALVDKNKMNVLARVGADSSNFDVIGLLESAAIVLLVGGAAKLLIGFLGCCGAMKQSQCLLCLYAVFLLVILIIELAAIVIAAVYRGKQPAYMEERTYPDNTILESHNYVEDELKDFLKKNINETYQGKIDTNEEFSLGLDYAQVYFQCCGTDSWEDFRGAKEWNRSDTVKVPETCCKLKDEDEYLKDQKATLVDPTCPTNPTDTNSNINKPCWDSIESYLKDRIAIVIGIAAGILALEVICIVFACCIISELRKGD